MVVVAAGVGASSNSSGSSTSKSRGADAAVTGYGCEVLNTSDLCLPAEERHLTILSAR